MKGRVEVGVDDEVMDGPKRGRAARQVSGRHLTAAGMLAAFVLAAVAGAFAQSFDPLGLYRSIRALKKARASHSRPIQLEDATTGRRATLYLGPPVADGFPLYLLLRPAEKKLHTHTLMLKAELSSATGESDPSHGVVIRKSPRPGPEESSGEELVGVLLSAKELDGLLAAESIEVEAGGWGEKLEAAIDEKGILKLQKFRDRFSDSSSS